MKTMMIQLLESLRERVTSNLTTIRQNEAEIRRLLNEPLSNQRSHDLNNRYNLSKKILQENRENIEIQNKIVSFLNKHKDVPEYYKDLLSLNSFELDVRNNIEKLNEKLIETNKSVERADNKPIEQKPETKVAFNSSPALNQVKSANEKIADSILELTIKGDLAFNSLHPQFNNDDFFNKLLNHHIMMEEYEICAKLVKTRRN